MQINPPSSQENATTEREDSASPPRCPVCSGSLVPLHNSYRCSRCCYNQCAGCDQFDIGSVSDG